MYVWVNTDQTTDQTTPRDGLLEVYRERVAFLERELERKDAILLNMTEAMKATSPLAHEEPSAPPESPETATVEETEHHPGGVQEGAQRPWWRRLFGG